MSVKVALAIFLAATALSSEYDEDLLSMVQRRAWENKDEPAVNLGPGETTPVAPVAPPIMPSESGETAPVDPSPLPPALQGMLQALAAQAMQLQTALQGIPAAAAQFMSNLKDNIFDAVARIVTQLGISAQERRGGLAEDEYALKQGNAYNEYSQGIKNIGGNFVGKLQKRTAAMLILLERVKMGQEKNPEHILGELRAVHEVNHKLDEILQDAVDKRRRDIAAAMMKYRNTSNLIQASSMSISNLSDTAGLAEFLRAAMNADTVATLVQQAGPILQAAGIPVGESAKKPATVDPLYDDDMKISEKNLLRDGGQFLKKSFNRGAGMLILLDRVDKGEEDHPEEIFQNLLKVEKASEKFDSILFDALAEAQKETKEALSSVAAPAVAAPVVAMDNVSAAISQAYDVPPVNPADHGTIDEEGLQELTKKLGPLPDRPDDWLMNTPIETFVAHCTSAVYALGGGAQARMMEQYMHFYRDFNNKFVAIEVVIKGALEKTDQFVLYRRNDECVLAVSGTDDIYDAGQDANVEKIEACGTLVHEGMHHEAQLVNDAFYKMDNAVLNYFTGEKCKKRYVTGHSLGGAVIEFMTICMSPLQDMQLDGFFSFGAPGISDLPIPVDRDLTMPTYRFWNTDSSLTPTVGIDSFDVVPWILEGTRGLGHPKMKSIEIEHTGNGTYVKHEKTPDQQGATEEPTGYLGMPKMSIHMYNVYEDGLSYVYGA